MKLKIGDTVTYQDRFLQSIGPTFTEEDYKYFHSKGIVVGKRHEGKPFEVCSVQFPNEDKARSIISTNLKRV